MCLETSTIECAKTIIRKSLKTMSKRSASRFRLREFVALIDLVRKFAVTHATVNNTLARLQRDGFIETEPYRPVGLTARGRRLARTAKKRHEIVERFLRRIGVNANTAAIDSEGIEHHVSPETLAAMEQVLQSGLPDISSADISDAGQS